MRYMLRPWGFQSDGQDGWTTWADNASALWTVYDGDEPTCDYRMIDHPTLGTVPYPETSYTLGLAQRTPAGDVRYFHTDHLGTTQAMTDASQQVDPRIVYTAFGEVIDTNGTVDTRYQYVGKDGYEVFAALPFIHVGYRWYDPRSGRFLQRDLIGLRGGPNVYVYLRSAPTGGTDADGLFDDRHYRGYGIPYDWGAGGSLTHAPPLRKHPNAKPEPLPEPLTPEQELEKLKLDWAVNSATCGILGKGNIGFWGGWVGAVVLDQLLNWGEPMNPLLGGSYEAYY